MFNKLEKDTALVGAVEKVMAENAIRRQADQVVKESLGINTLYGLPVEDKAKYETLKEGFTEYVIKEGVQLSEISKERLEKYKDKAGPDQKRERIRADIADDEGDGKAFDKHYGKMMKRENGIRAANKRLGKPETDGMREETEQLDEVSEKRLRKYLGRTLGSDRNFKKRLGQDYSKENRNREVGTERALAKTEKKYGKEYYSKVKVAASEETQLDEISTDRLKDYKEKATDSIKTLAKSAAKYDNKDPDVKAKAEKDTDKMFKRSHMKSVAGAKMDHDNKWSKLGKVKSTNEELEQLQEISKERIKDYIKKAKDDVFDKREKMNDSYKKSKTKGLSFVGKHKHLNAEYKYRAAANKRADNIKKAEEKAKD